jgi:hypothetical protein
MSAFVKITCIKTIGVDSAKFGNETHFISFVRLATSPPTSHGGGGGGAGKGARNPRDEVASGRLVSLAGI